jgi:hypothetical protein
MKLTKERFMHTGMVYTRKLKWKISALLTSRKLWSKRSMAMANTFATVEEDLRIINVSFSYGKSGRNDVSDTQTL